MNHKITKKIFIDTMIVMIVAELSGAFTCVIDGMITSRFLGELKIAAQGIAGSYFSIVSIISGILMIGCQTLVVESISKGKKEEASKILSATCFVGVLAALLITLILWIFPTQVAVLFGCTAGDTETINNVAAYLRGASIGAPFWLLFVVITPIAQIDGGGKYATIGSLIMGVADITFDILFAVVLPLDLFGMGLATSCSHIAGAIVILLFLFSKKSTIKFSTKDMLFTKMPKILSDGLPRAVSMLSRTIGPIILNIIVLNIIVNETIGMSALSIQRSLSFCASSIGWGIGGAMLMIGSLYYNEKNYSEYKATLLITLRSILIYVGIATVVLYFTSPYLARIYVADYQNNVEFYNLTVKALKYYFLSLPFLAFNVSFASYLQVNKKPILTNILNVCIECVALVGYCYAFSLLYGYDGFFLGYLIGEAVLFIICASIFAINFFTCKNIYKKLLLPEDFIKDSTLVIEKNLYQIEDAINLSEEITSLVKGTKLSEKQIYKLSLAVEEMATNVFTHGMTKDNKKHNLLIRIIVEDEKVIISTIDDCKKFDITKRLKTFEMDSNNPTKNIGIRMILLLAKEIKYSNTMNINNLQIIL